MARFISVPTEVEAHQWFTPTDEKHKPMAGVFRRPLSKEYFVITLQNQPVTVHNGEWIVTEENGNNHYPVAPDVFAKRYIPIEEPKTEEEN